MIVSGDTFTSTRGHYTVGDQQVSDDIFDLFDADVNGRPVTLRTGAVPAADDDLLVNEALALGGLTAFAETDDPRFGAYLPKMVDTFDGPDGQINVFDRLDGFHPLTDVRDAYPDGVDPRDMAWMYRRLLVAVGFTHQAGYAHGAILPQSVYIHPEQHGLVLHNWTHAVPFTSGTTTDGTAAIVGQSFGPYPIHPEWYPPETRTVQAPIYPQTDIYMAAKVAAWLVGGETDGTLPEGVPVEYRAFFNGCTKPRIEDRPTDAWDVLKYFDDLIERLYGKRKFRPFTLNP